MLFSIGNDLERTAGFDAVRHGLRRGIDDQDDAIYNRGGKNPSRIGSRPPRSAHRESMDNFAGSNMRSSFFPPTMRRRLSAVQARPRGDPILIEAVTAPRSGSMRKISFVVV